jgi:hypothetical protein
MSPEESGDWTVVLPLEPIARQKALLLAATQCSKGDCANLPLCQRSTTDSAWWAANAAAFWIVHDAHLLIPEIPAGN